MANRNTRALRKEIHNARLAGASTVVWDVPVRDYHNKEDKDIRYTTRRIPIHRRVEDGLVSSSPRRNMAMRVAINKGPDGRGFSVTFHEPLVRGRFVTPKNHGYLEYRQPGNSTAVSAN